MKKVVSTSLAIGIVLGGFIAINHGYAQEDNQNTVLTENNQNTGQTENSQNGIQKKECEK